MAKGNMILGYLRGAIGDIVFWRAKGQQMARARNRAPANPRTEYQMTQRAKWADVAKFVKMAPPRFFKYAFEGKGVSLTDYNVFYRENILRSPMMSRTASANPAYPALGNFVMSRGSLQSIGAITEYSAVTLDTPFFKLAESNNVTIPSETGRTVAWLTNQLLALSPSRYRVGDILTFVKISCNNFGTPLAYPELSDYGYSFEYYQIVLSLSDLSLVKSRLGGFARLNTLGDNKLLGISFGSTSGSAGAVEWSSDLKATCMIHTRNISGGLLVSSEELTVNDNYALLTEQALTNSAYIQQVLTDWRSAETAILQGQSLESASVVNSITSLKLYNSGLVYQNLNEYTIPKLYNIEFEAFEAVQINLSVTEPDKMSSNQFTVEGIEITSPDIAKLSDTSIQFAFGCDVETAPTDPVVIKYNGETIATLNFL